MDSTEIAPEHVKALTAFYRRHLLPLCKQAGATMAARLPDELNTFYVTRKTTHMTPVDFELRMADEGQIVQSLRARWKGTPLETVPEPLLKLARQFEQTQQHVQVSAFVYEMF